MKTQYMLSIDIENKEWLKAHQEINSSKLFNNIITKLRNRDGGRTTDNRGK
jgi:hypothetical protein